MTTKTKGSSPHDIAIEKIEPNDYNPNEMTDAEFAECKAEIQHLGTIPKPIVVRPLNGKFIIIDGEHNWKAARELNFTTLPCEVLELNIVEAMRQTYKRNMHGTFNLIKLGLMFKAALKKTKVSHRDLAKQYEVSEGTIRNALLYCEAKELRNGYAFEKLGIRQVRLYLKIPPVIRDKWLDAGADTKLLLRERELKHWEGQTGKAATDASFDDIESYLEKCEQPGASHLNRLNHIDEWGLGDLVKGTREGFMPSIQKINKLIHWMYWKLCGQDKDIREKIKPFALLMFDLFDLPGDDFLPSSGGNIRKEFQKCFRLIYYKGNFTVTPEEVEKMLKDSKVFGCEPGYSYTHPQFKYVESMLHATLLERKVIDSPLDVDKLPDPAELIMASQLETNCPDYLKDLKLPATIKAMILTLKNEHKDFMYSTPELEQEARLKTGQMLEKQLAASAYFKPDLKEINDKFIGYLARLGDKQKMDSLTNKDIVKNIVTNTQLYNDPKEAEQKDKFTHNLLQLELQELRNINYIMDYMKHIKEMRGICAKADRWGNK